MGYDVDIEPAKRHNLFMRVPQLSTAYCLPAERKRVELENELDESIEQLELNLRSMMREEIDPLNPSR